MMCITNGVREREQIWEQTHQSVNSGSVATQA